MKRRCLSCGILIRHGSYCPGCYPYNTPEWRALSAAVLERDSYTCAECGGRADTADHIIPVARGGQSTMGNLQAMCRACNSRKRGK